MNKAGRGGGGGDKKVCEETYQCIKVVKMR